MSGISASAENMALDEALLASACRTGIPVLRFYGWSPATVSIGFAQKVAETLNLEEIAKRKLAWVRRPTGGRAVLHDMEVTYSVSVPASAPLYQLGLAASYECLCHPIIMALQYLGIPAVLSPHSSAGFISASCFTAPGTTDILVHHRKIVGSAQVRNRDGFLQHGSIVLRQNLETLFAVVRTPGDGPAAAARRAARFTTSVSDEAGRAVSFQEMVAALIRGFSSADDVNLVRDIATPEETALCSQLCKNKYACDKWNALR